jgi:hypothetical protein
MEEFMENREVVGKNAEGTVGAPAQIRNRHLPNTHKKVKA